MTVDPRLQLTPGEYLIHPDGSASKVVDRRNMTVDEILGRGWYIDKRGRTWDSVKPLTGDRFWRANLPGGYMESLSPAQMRLLIERDMHRDECEGLGYCLGHPVPHVIVARYRPAMLSIHEAGGRSEVVDFRHDLPAAVDAARALAVGE